MRAVWTESAPPGAAVAAAFRPASPALADRLHGASAADLKGWADNVLEAPTLNDGFDRTRRSLEDRETAAGDGRQNGAFAAGDRQNNAPAKTYGVAGELVDVGTLVVGPSVEQTAAATIDIVPFGPKVKEAVSLQKPFGLLAKAPVVRPPDGVRDRVAGVAELAVNGVGRPFDHLQLGLCPTVVVGRQCFDR